MILARHTVRLIVLSKLTLFYRVYFESGVAFGFEQLLHKTSLRPDYAFAIWLDIQAEAFLVVLTRVVTELVADGPTPLALEWG